MDHPLNTIFIGGTGRSGSNILRARLAEHSQVASLPFEARFTVDPDGVLPAYRALCAGPTPFEGQVVLQRLQRLLTRLRRRTLLDHTALTGERLLRVLGVRSNLRSYAAWELDRHIPGFSDHAAQLLEDVTKADYPAIWPGRPGVMPLAKNRLVTCDDGMLERAFSTFLTSCFNAVSERTQASTLVDDNTYNLFFAPELTRLLPGARLIHILRDPRDVVASLMKQRWAPSDALETCAFYKASMTTMLRNVAKAPAAHQLTIRLEDLCADPMSVLEPVFASVGLTAERQYSVSDFNAANTGRWHDLSAADQQILTRELSSWVERFGYYA